VNTDARGCICVEIPGITLLDAQRDWLIYIGYGSRGIATAVHGECLQAGVVNKSISPDPFNLSSRLVETAQGVRLTVWLTESDMLRAERVHNMDRNQALQKYVGDFAMLEYRRMVPGESNSSQESPQNLQSGWSASISEEAVSVKKINEDQANISCAAEAIVRNTVSGAKTGNGPKKEINRPVVQAEPGSIK
jgi:hypothetical protein